MLWGRKITANKPLGFRCVTAASHMLCDVTHSPVSCDRVTDVTHSNVPVKPVTSLLFFRKVCKKECMCYASKYMLFFYWKELNNNKYSAQNEWCGEILFEWDISLKNEDVETTSKSSQYSTPIYA
mgnify:CR=1 FL=1